MAEEQGNIYAPTAVRVDDVRAEGDMELAARMTRLGAAIVDALIIGVPFYIVFFMVVPDPFGLATAANESLLSNTLFSLVLFACAFALYAVINWVPLEANGQTWGKKLLNIRVVRSDGSPVGAKRVLFRRYLPIQAVSILPFLGSIIALVNVVMIFRESRKCLHDDIADTVVVKV